jgi:TonB family protein
VRDYGALFTQCGAQAPLAGRYLAASLALHAAAIFVLLSLRFAAYEPAPRVSRQEVTLFAPRLSPPPARRIRPLPPVPRADRAAPRAFRLPEPGQAQPATRPEPAPVAPEHKIEAAPAVASVIEPGIAPALLPPPVRTGVLTEARTAPPAERLDLVRSSGFQSAQTGGAVARFSMAASTGAFGTAEASQAAAPDRKVAAGVFGDARAASPQASRPGGAALPPDTSPVEVLFKPRPEYTNEARAMRLEGEVLLEVLFAASGDARVLRLVRGLGHGLDDAAADAARQIRFRPARRGGSPVDSTAIVRIVFQLAY